MLRTLEVDPKTLGAFKEDRLSSSLWKSANDTIQRQRKSNAPQKLNQLNFVYYLLFSMFSNVHDMTGTTSVEMKGTLRSGKIQKGFDPGLVQSAFTPPEFKHFSY